MSEFIDRLETIVGNRTKANAIADSTPALFKLLVESDQLGKAAIIRAQTGSAPPIPQGGQAQMAFVLYWVKYEPALIQKILADMPELIQRLWTVIDDVIKTEYPPTITQAEYAWARAQPGGIVASDGTIMGTGTYQDFDDGWLWAFFNYLFNLFDPGRIAPFQPSVRNPPYYHPMQTSGGQTRIALVGDWGTGVFDGGGGYDPATDVMSTVSSLNPDYIIHLGDVYYAGTQDAPPPFEESEHFLKMWPSMPAGRSFTLNSNHEMYGGANGYFNVALGRGASAQTPFAHQNGYSYFALTMGDIAVVGLDAAYFDKSSMYMTGGLGDPDKDPQYAFLKGVAANHSQLVLLTHQTAMSMDGTRLLQLWTDVTGAIDSSSIKLWYWGHIHMGIAYDHNSALGAKGVLSGCSGHGAIPIGVPWGLQQQGQGIAWTPSKPVGGNADANRVCNGFAMLTVSASGVSEAFYNAGDTTPAWTRP